MDNSVGLDLRKEFLHGRKVGDVAIVVRHGAARVPVRVGAQVEHRDLCLGMALDDVAHDMATQEPASTDDDHLTERWELRSG